MILHLKKKADVSCGRFKSTEFDCHCQREECTKTLLDTNLIKALEELVDVIGEIEITSGFRCQDHNKEVGGVLNSQHTLGVAADVKSEMTSPKGIAIAATAIPLFSTGGIGLYSQFTHLDVRGKKARWGIETKC